MGKKKPGPKPKPSESLHVMLKPEVRAGIVALAKREARSLTAEVQRALERHLEANGMGPAKGKE